MIRKLPAASLVLLGMQVLSVAAGAQNYPTQPVKIIVPSSLRKAKWGRKT